MQVFVLVVGEAYQTDQVLGVYSTREKAMAAGEEYSKAWEEWRMLDQSIFIRTCDLDGAPGELETSARMV